MNSITTLLKLEPGTQYDYAPIITRVINGVASAGRWRTFRVTIVGLALDQEINQERVIYQLQSGKNGPIKAGRLYVMTLARFANHFLPLEEEEVAPPVAEPLPERVAGYKSQSKIN